MTLGEIKSRASRASGMSTSGADGTLLIDFAIRAVLEFQKATKSNIAKASLAVTAGSGDYVLDADILNFTDIWYAPLSGDRDYLLERVDSSEITRQRLLVGSVDANVRQYALQGANVLMLHPTPLSSSDVLHIMYSGKAVSAMSADAHDPSSSVYGGVAVEYHDALAYYVMWKACELEDHSPSKMGSAYKLLWEEELLKAKKHLLMKGGVKLGPATLGRGRNRRDRVPPTPGTDIGY